MQTLLSVSELAERWGYAPETIRRMEQEGRLHRVHNLPGVKFSLAEIVQLESIGTDALPLTVYERKKLENRIAELEDRVTKLTNRLCKIQQLSIGG